MRSYINYGETSSGAAKLLLEYEGNLACMSQTSVYRFGFHQVVIFLFWAQSPLVAEDQPNLHDLPNDLTVPMVISGTPTPGQRVWQKLPEYRDFQVAHALYLPPEWKPETKWPVIFEFPGNGNFQNMWGDRSLGRVEDCQLGFGLTAGHQAIWVSLPFVSLPEKTHSIQWWGETSETIRYCKQVVEQVCRDWSGDRDRLILSGFSRGAIACSYIGLADAEIAAYWRAIFAHSHYDGVRQWPYAHSDSVSATRRLLRLGTRPQWISHEQSIEPVQKFLSQENLLGNHQTFVALPFPNHSSDWVLKEIPIRRQARQWLHDVLK